MVCRAADRLSHLCVALDLSPAEFAHRLDLPKRRRLPRRPNDNLQKKILTTFPNVNPCWLLKGKGEILWSVYTTTNTANNYIGVNNGQCVQHITQYVTASSANSVLEQQLRANISDKEAIIQLLMRQLGYSNLNVATHT